MKQQFKQDDIDNAIDNALDLKIESIDFRESIREIGKMGTYIADTDATALPKVKWNEYFTNVAKLSDATQPDKMKARSSIAARLEKEIPAIIKTLEAMKTAQGAAFPKDGIDVLNSLKDEQNKVVAFETMQTSWSKAVQKGLSAVRANSADAKSKPYSDAQVKHHTPPSPAGAARPAVYSSTMAPVGNNHQYKPQLSASAYPAASGKPMMAAYKPPVPARPHATTAMTTGGAAASTNGKPVTYMPAPVGKAAMTAATPATANQKTAAAY